MTQTIKNQTGLAQPSYDRQSKAFHKGKLIQFYLQNEKSLLEICHEQSRHPRTIRRWIQSYKEQGLTGLERQKRQDCGKRRSCSQELQLFIEGLHLQQPHLSGASIYRKIKDYCLKHSYKYPSYRTVCHIISQIPQSMKTLAHQGPKVYKQQFDLLYSHEATLPNEIWQADHVLLDIFIYTESAKEKRCRPWLTVIIDDYSRAIAGYELSFLAPSATKTALCLRQAIWRKNDPVWMICGIPGTLYTDHGSDFTSQHIEQVCMSLKMRLIFSQVGEPRGRGKIERFFRTLNQRLLSELEGYTGSKYPRAKLFLSDLDVLVRSFILNYNQSTHSMTQEIPKERWENQGFLPRMPDSIEQLDLLLLTVAKPRMIQRNGIRFQGLCYLDPLLADYVGETVTIRYDPVDITYIRVFYKNNYLCQPICQALDEESVSLKDIQAARNNRRRNLQNEIKHRLSLVDAILNSKQRKPLVIKPSDKAVKSVGLKLYENDE